MILLALATASKITANFEILVIDDGSDISSANALDQIKSLVPQLRVIHHPKNTGYGGALRSGFANARGELIFILIVMLSTIFVNCYPYTKLIDPVLGWLMVINWKDMILGIEYF